MSIKVEGVSKSFGSQLALNNVSFEINSGEIVGFLGPNGAGKSTMMKIITSFIPSSSGNVSVCGLDVNTKSIEVRKNIGYLPEHNPLYLEMYVKEFLAFIGDIHKIENKKERVEEMIELTGLTPEKNKKIGQLSKGYRQRVGLAAAMIHDPEVLILDEPTTGLDPNQIVEIRNLIKTIGSKKTVMLSTHIMQEVEAICDRAIIIKKGQIVANEKIANLQNIKANSTVFIEFETEVDEKLFEVIEGVKSISKTAPNKITLEYEDGKDPRGEISKIAVTNDWIILGMMKEENTLENAFQSLTKD